MIFEVMVEKTIYATGKLTVDCENIDQAIESVQNKINRGEIQTTDIEWSDLIYEDCSFQTTGDVD